MRLFIYFAVGATLAACSRSSPASGRARDSVAAGAPTASSSVAAPAHGVATAGPVVPASGAATMGASHATSEPGSCPRTGLWAVCSVEKRLTQAGFVVRSAEGRAARRAGFMVAPVAYTLGHSRLEIFIYPNQAAANADAAKLDTVYAAPRGTTNPWGVAPTFVRSANLLAVFLTDNPTQAERLTLALTAGAPQP